MMLATCAEGVIEYHGKMALRLNPADLNATGVIRMIVKNMIPKRSVMIAVVVIALMTLTAGVAVAASMKAKNIEAGGIVVVVTITPGSTVETKFKTSGPDGDIKLVKINT
ncbi:MAG: hypothetical protein IH960_10060, partial [Chloroflexi bacterium]|nr:hypothetical protein [Chloroflexota bacterium]